METSDEEILRQSYKNPKHFGLLVDRYRKEFFKKSFYIVRNGEDAEDIVQEAFVKIYRHGEKFLEKGGSFRPWARMIVFNCAIDSYNKRKKMLAAEFNEEILEQSAPDFSRVSAEEYSSDFVSSMMRRLKGPFARVLTLHFLEDRTCKEIAQATDQSPGNVRVQIHRAKQAFRKVYKDMGYE